MMRFQRKKAKRLQTGEPKAPDDAPAPGCGCEGFVCVHYLTALSERTGVSEDGLYRLAQAMECLAHMVRNVHKGRFADAISNQTLFKYFADRIGYPARDDNQKEAQLRREQIRQEWAAKPLWHTSRATLIDAECRRRAEEFGYPTDRATLMRLQPEATRWIDRCAEQARLVGHWLWTWLEGGQTNDDSDGKLCWHCGFCGSLEPAQRGCALGDSEPCCYCSEGTARVLTRGEPEEAEQERRRNPRRAYSDGGDGDRP